MKKILTFALSLMIAGLAVAGCGGEKKDAAVQDPSAKTKVAFVYIGSANDGGYSMTHDIGRKMVEKELPNVETSYVESVPAGADAERVISQLAAQGNKIIFTNSFGYMDPTINVAKKYPDVTFLHCSGYKTAPNVGTYFGRMYEARYLTGIVAGKQTKSNIIGYVAAFPIPEVVRGINAFTLGVRSVNPEAIVKVVWTNTWYNPAGEKQAGLTLIDFGADVIAQHQDTPGPQQAAEEKGVYGIGYDLDMSNAAPNASLTAAVWNWGPYYVDVIKQITAGTWKSSAYWGGMKDKLVDIAPFGKAVSEETKQITNDAKAKIIDGSLKVFSGPIKDQSGSVKVQSGQTMSDEELLKFDWFVEGVEGSIQ
ncbi:MAG TPA: BMP family ABC transporter substrate-binding protein [Candidatus Avacidaminococcus intestinavium]|uniref:BMP family ABC transporter substrate-binding protein n=1 Tax=Candidatus Avacidaminococcus intestinavium TaxID=2840684 RepID=A0A9D1SLM8_9FIRM|nr:BMP family ABC transporter substrate-binding protein [Candidatus Avacidaminococcus intestinavium]